MALWAWAVEGRVPARVVRFTIEPLSRGRAPAMSVRTSPLLGYNNNVRHKGKVFHIQTEDSGIKYGHIMTHLFTDGGRILKSVKTSYGEYVTSERMAEIVREMMKQQHKAMFIALRDGKFDIIADAAPDASPSSRPLAPEGPTEPRTTDATDAKRPAAVPPPLPRSARPERLAEGPIGTPVTDSEIPPTLRDSAELTLDVEVLERAAAAADPGSPELGTTSHLPPPPAQLLRERASTPPPSNAPVPPPVPRRAPSPLPPAGTSERRYAPTRPASIFGQARPQQGKSIFGDEVIGDKSLDEVILSYLADDLDVDKE